MQENIIHVAGIKVRVFGTGLLRPTLFALDVATNKQLIPITMHSLDATEPLRLANFVSQKVSLRLETLNKDETCTITRIVIYAKPIYSMLPGNV